MICREKGFFFLTILRQKNSVCLQLYQTVLLLVFRPNQPPMWDSFNFPAYCVCKYAAVDEYVKTVNKLNEKKSHTSEVSQ